MRSTFEPAVDNLSGCSERSGQKNLINSSFYYWSSPSRVARLRSGVSTIYIYAGVITLMITIKQEAKIHGRCADEDRSLIRAQVYILLFGTHVLKQPLLIWFSSRNLHMQALWQTRIRALVYINKSWYTIPYSSIYTKDASARS